MAFVQWSRLGVWNVVTTIEMEVVLSKARGNFPSECVIFEQCLPPESKKLMLDSD
jgi:hypothetical protein